MLFSSPLFLYLFLPITLACYYVSPGKLKNTVLLIASLVFYAWGGVSLLALLLSSTLVNYFFGLLIDRVKNHKHKRNVLALGVSINLGLLMYFKYANFITLNINYILDIFKSGNINFHDIALPIGISFFTFQALSYLVDVYRGTTKVQRNFVKLALFISLFPQLIAGPIVRYHDISLQLNKREHRFDIFASGIRRFILGLARKVLIANPMAYIADTAFDMQNPDLSISMAWLGIFAYAIQIYYDFAGYSDMAIGLARMFGFELLENFNSPYIAKSIKEFWKRWHISLSSWFRDYLYIPLGGNRKSNSRTYLNLIIVFFITGLWHGAAWNFVIWGLIHGLFLIIERLGFDKILKKLPNIIQHAYTLIIVLLAWVFFRAENSDHAVNFIRTMVGLNNPDFAFFQLSEFIGIQFYIVSLVAILGSFNVFQCILSKINLYLQTASKFSGNISYHIFEISKIIFIVSMLFLSTLYLITGSYNPFIYFRF
ncbi:MAG: MBOAT family protein [Bacteroidales bacterium]|nr:MBOAT family protein [Bacteroidales bacterium]